MATPHLALAVMDASYTLLDQRWDNTDTIMGWCIQHDSTHCWAVGCGLASTLISGIQQHLILLSPWNSAPYSDSVTQCNHSSLVTVEGNPC
jgi:hypothetical protein